MCKISASYDHFEKTSVDIFPRICKNERFNNFETEEKKEFKNSWKKDFNNKSILSLHISAYENSNKVVSNQFSGKNDNDLKIEKSNTFNASTFVMDNPFEFQRQQNDKVSEPEMSQYKASQRLFNSNKALTDDQGVEIDDKKAAEEEEQEGSGEDVEDEDASDEEDELMNDNTEEMEKLTFDFEAFPLDTGDVDGLVNLLTQIFLRTNVNCEAVAKALVEMSPLGCVYRPAEEVEDEDSENAIYGVLSMLELGGEASFQTDIANLFLNRARKVSTPDIIKKFEAIFNNKDNKQKNYLIVNERMLHFPDQIAAPAFKSLKDDLEDMKLLNNINSILFVSKIRIANNAQAVATSVQNSGGKKKVGKAEKKRRAAAALENAHVIYDNAEEEILFNNAGLIKPIYFQYSVENDVESDSKFHRIVKDGVTYLPYRRVTILSKDDFVKFVELVSQVSA